MVMCEQGWARGRHPPVLPGRGPTLSLCPRPPVLAWAWYAGAHGPSLSQIKAPPLEQRFPRAQGTERGPHPWTRTLRNREGQRPAQARGQQPGCGVSASWRQAALGPLPWLAPLPRSRLSQGSPGPGSLRVVPPRPCQAHAT